MSDINSSAEANEALIDVVCSGVYVLDRQPPENILEAGDFITAQEFGQAGIDAGKTENYGQGVMRDIALRMVGLEVKAQRTVDGHHGKWIVRGTPEYDRYQEILMMMNNPALIKQGSRNRLLLGTQLVHDVWQAGEGNISSENLPILGKVGHKVVSMLFV